MAEFTDLGARCDVDSCKQLDFLPFHCNGCLKIFCLDHRSPDSHNCTQENIVTASGNYDGEKSYSCTYDGCKTKELTPIHCPQCAKNFCLSHRLQQDHRCEKIDRSEKVNKTAQHVEQILASRPVKEPQSSKRRGTKSSATAAKVALMKMKMNAMGDKGLPDSERIYLNILLPKQCQEKSKPMFFSKTWSIGRTIDSIASRLSLKNENNKSNAKKLRLFNGSDGCIMPTETTLSETTESEQLFSGSAVILEYVDNDCMTLENPQLYGS